MNEIIEKAKSLFDKGEIDVMIGYENGTKNPRPFFAKNGEDAERLVFDDSCSGNMAVYLTRKDLIGGKRVGILASYFALRSIVELFREHQLNKDLLRIFTYDKNKQLVELESVDDVKEYLSETPAPAHPNDDELKKKLGEMNRSERWEFWTSELSKCFKCYACRAACPMCYCVKCIVNENRPQWIQSWVSPLSNMEWQIARVMHMTGRCSDCGSCGAACPMGIPVHLLAHHIYETVLNEFGEPTDDGNALAIYKPEDRETFIH